MQTHKNRIMDLIGISLTLAIGISGLNFLSDPMRMLIPEHPMISARDWPGSRESRKLEIIDADNWEQSRELALDLFRQEFFDGYHSADIEQRAVWFADQARTVDQWNNSGEYIRETWQLVEENLADHEQPISQLFCDPTPLPADRNSCRFFAYRGHWFTEIDFRSYDSVLLPDSEILRIVARAKQLLMSATEPKP